MTDIEAAYLAGILDGEGCIMINRFATSRSPIGFQYRVILEITMCDQMTIEYIASFTDRPVEKRLIPSGRVACKVIWRNEPAAVILRRILPYLQGKREQATICLEFHSRTPGRGRTYKPEDFNILETLRLKVKELKVLRC